MNVCLSEILVLALLHNRFPMKTQFQHILLLSQSCLFIKANIYSKMSLGVIP